MRDKRESKTLMKRIRFIAWRHACRQFGGESPLPTWWRWRGREPRTTVRRMGIMSRGWPRGNTVQLRSVY